MVDKRGDQLSRIITVLVVLVVVVFVVILFRESRQNQLNPSGAAGSQSQNLPQNAAETLLTIETPGVEQTEAPAASVYYLPQDVTMEMVSDMVKAPGGATLTLTNGQKLMVSDNEIAQMDPKVKFYLEYTLKGDGAQ